MRHCFRRVYIIIVRHWNRLQLALSPITPWAFGSLLCRFQPIARQVTLPGWFPYPASNLATSNCTCLPFNECGIRQTGSNTCYCSPFMVGVGYPGSPCTHSSFKLQKTAPSLPYSCAVFRSSLRVICVIKNPLVVTSC